VKFPESVPTKVVIGFLIFLALLFGGYFVGSTHALSSTPTYITDSSGSSAASVSSAGHLSVHVADPGLPPYKGPFLPKRVTFAAQNSLLPGQCYQAFVRGRGQLLNATLTDLGSGNGRPAVLIRVDRAVLWLEDKTASSTPFSPITGAAQSGSSLVFGFPYAISFNLFSGAAVCWHGPGRSDKFAITMTISGEGGLDLLPASLLFDRHGNTFTWTFLQGQLPVSFALYGTSSTEVSYLKMLSPLIPYRITPHASRVYSVTVTKPVPPRIYVFEYFGRTDPDRIGPFGDWTGL
jgi:hypothetical protein